jgi:hypothetical protein
MTKIGKTTYRLLLNVRHWSGPDYIDSVTLESDAPFAPIHEGDRLTIGDLEGYTESRLTHAVVERVLHSLSGRAGVLDASTHLKHDVTIYAVQDKEP